VQWDGKYITVVDTGVSPAVIYQLAISGSSGTEVGSTALGGSEKIEQTWIQGKRIIGPNLTSNSDVGFWNYPAGGSTIKSISGVQSNGSTVSLAPH
jgi:hypothetical protein